MKKQTEGELHQNSKAKAFNSKLWIRVISVVLSVATVAVGCLGIALFTSNDKLAVLQAELIDANKKLEVLGTENQEAAGEIDSLKSGLALTDEELVRLAKEYARVRVELKLSRGEQEILKARLQALEKANKV